jgi:hypothetical protein
MCGLVENRNSAVLNNNHHAGQASLPAMLSTHSIHYTLVFNEAKSEDRGEILDFALKDGFTANGMLILQLSSHKPNLRKQAQPQPISSNQREPPKQLQQQKQSTARPRPS